MYSVIEVKQKSRNAWSYLRTYLASFSSSHAVFPPPKFLLDVFSKPFQREIDVS